MSLVSVLMFVVGIILGATGCLLVIRQTYSESSIERQLRELQEEFTAYRENVNQHFNQTTKLVNELTSNYVNVQKHLEDAAESFAQPPKSFELDETKDKETENRVKNEALVKLETPKTEATEDAQFEQYNGVEPPKDYASTPAKEVGTLSEEYGFQHSSK